MVSALYAVAGVLLLIKCSIDVLLLRSRYRVAWGDGGFSELQSALRVQSNAMEYLPLALLLLLFMEMNGARTWMLHACGVLTFAGRLMQYYGFQQYLVIWRRVGMGATLAALVLMVLINLWYMPWELVFSLR